MRPTRDAWAMSLVAATALRSTCLRRQVGCVLLSARGHVLSTGYNGVAAGQKHCNEKYEHRVYSVGSVDLLNNQLIGKHLERSMQNLGPEHPHACPGATSPSGTNLDGCQAIHAEQNALLQCRDIYAIDTCYVSCSPCLTCIKLLLNTSCQRIVFAELYSHAGSQILWESSGRIFEHYTSP